MKKKSYVEFIFDDHIVRASQGQTVLDAILEARLEIDHSCGGNATCGTCRVFVVKNFAQVPARNEIETEFANDRNLADDERLCCQLVCDDQSLQDVQLLSPGRSVTKKGLE